MHTFSPAKMWIAGLQALQKPLLHLHTQFNRDLPWAEIDMDFMNLNQSAHGDREFGYLETRMGAAPEDGRRALAGPARSRAAIAAWARAACGWHEAQHLKVARFGDNMRNVAVTEGDKVEAQIRLGVSVNGFGVGDLVRADATASPTTAVDALRATTRIEYELVPGCCARRRAARSRCATPPGSRRGSGPSSTRAGSGPSRTRSRISAA